MHCGIAPRMRTLCAPRRRSRRRRRATSSARCAPRAPSTIRIRTRLRFLSLAPPPPALKRAQWRALSIRLRSRHPCAGGAACETQGDLVAGRDLRRVLDDHARLGRDDAIAPIEDTLRAQMLQASGETTEPVAERCDAIRAAALPALARAIEHGALWRRTPAQAHQPLPGLRYLAPAQRLGCARSACQA